MDVGFKALYVIIENIINATDAEQTNRGAARHLAMRLQSLKQMKLLERPCNEGFLPRARELFSTIEDALQVHTRKRYFIFRLWTARTYKQQFATWETQLGALTQDLAGCHAVPRSPERAGHKEVAAAVVTRSYSNGDRYAGNMSNNKPHGRGQMVYANNNEYDGEWHVNQPHGKGTFTWGNGDCYTGQWFNGHRQGTGTMKTSDGHEYNGRYVGGKRQGTGFMQFKDGSTYAGEFVNDKKCGQGLFTYKTGRYYQGAWFDNKADGLGKEVEANGTAREGIWSDGIFIRPAKPSDYEESRAINAETAFHS